MIKQVYTNEKVQTGLVVEVDGVRINYMKREDVFAYVFTVFVGDREAISLEKARELVLKVVEEMESQSYDHGAEWRRTSIVMDISKLERYGECSFIVNFRVRDAY
ncbi:hypothetical protein M2146_002513 [Lachnospiraceae bacterium PF1-22]